MRIAYSFVVNSPYFDHGSIKLFQTGRIGCRYVIAGRFNWDLPARSVDGRIQRPEQIALWFSDSAVHGILAPEIRADRPDFPRDFPHLNIVPDSEPAYLCLAREGIASLFSRGGLHALLQRASTWLRDAASGQLDHDGWEPTPRSSTFNAVLDIGWFQRSTRSSKVGEAGHSLGIALLFIEEIKKGERKAIHAQLVPRTKAMEKIWLTEEGDADVCAGRSTYTSSWFMAWGPRIVPAETRFTRPVTTTSDLLDFATIAGCENKVRVFLDLICSPESKGRALWFVIVIGTWRPKRLIPTIPGLAEGEFGKLELNAFAVFVDEKDGIRTVGSIYTLRLLAEAIPDNLNRLAGFNALPRNTVLVGVGALGSKIGQHLVREGAPTLRVVDCGYLQPHNIARHVLGRNSLHFKKANELRDWLTSVVKTASVTAFDISITDVPIGRFREDITGHESGTLIDSTASMDVQRRLCRNDVVMRTAKVELAHGGRIGLLLYEGRGRNPRIDDLKAMVPLFGNTIPEVAEWLNHGDEFTVHTGMGCASASMLMSDSQVSQHAGNFMATLGHIVRGCDHSAGVGIAVTDQQGHLTKWIWHDVSPVSIHQMGENQSGWQVRIAKQVLNEIGERSASAAPQETGGYLYGAFDLTLRAVYAVWASEPQALEASGMRLQLPPAGSSDRETQVLRCAGGRLSLLGTWHSHPGGSAGASSQDLLQFAADTVLYACNPSPHMVLIVGVDGTSVLLGFPEYWSDSN